METAKEVYSLTAEAAEIAAKKKQEEELNRHVTPEEEAEYLRQAGYFGAAEQQSFQFVPNGGTSPSEILEQVRSERSNKFVPNSGTREDETAEHTFNHNTINERFLVNCTNNHRFIKPFNEKGGSNLPVSKP